RLAASEALLLGLIESQLSEPDHPTPDYLSVNSRYLYAALNWCTHTYYELADKVKELVSAGPFQIPADSSIFSDADVRAAFEANWETAFAVAAVRYKFTKLAWDFLGSEFASRHTQYERFYGGPPFLNDMYSYWHAPWQDRRSTLDAIMADMELPALSPDRD
ncbi:MAG: 4-hydroxyphenylacetate 3-hydroxylase C-terminal domain-containing protein, partial [Hyphomicrobiaceae bacterium]